MFQNSFCFHCRTGSWHKGVGMKIGHTLLCYSPAPLGRRESGRRDVEKRANMSLFNWLWPQLSPCWLCVLWKQTLMYYWCFHLYGTCPDAGLLWAHVWVLRRAGLGLPLYSPLYLRSSCCPSTVATLFPSQVVSPQTPVATVFPPSGRPSWLGLQQVGSGTD